MHQPNLQSVLYPFWDIAIAVLGWDCERETPINLGEVEAERVGDGTGQKTVGEFL